MGNFNESPKLLLFRVPQTADWPHLRPSPTLTCRRRERGCRLNALISWLKGKWLSSALEVRNWGRSCPKIFVDVNPNVLRKVTLRRHLDDYTCCHRADVDRTMIQLKVRKASCMSTSVGMEQFKPIQGVSDFPVKLWERFTWHSSMSGVTQTIPSMSLGLEK